MQILGPLGVYFDAVVIEVKKNTFIQIRFTLIILQLMIHL